MLGDRRRARRRSDKAWLIRIIKLIEIPVMLAAAAGVIAGSPTVLLALLFTMGIQAAFFGPLKYAILPDLLAPERAAARQCAGRGRHLPRDPARHDRRHADRDRHGEISVAALIVAVALAAWGRAWRSRRPARRRAAPAFEWNFAATTARVIGQAAERPVPFRAMLGISWFWLAGALYLSQFPSYVRFVLGSEEAVVTLFLAVFSVGVGAGSMLCNRLAARPDQRRGPCRGACWASRLFSIDLCAGQP